jgi:hypothetical protein
MGNKPEWKHDCKGCKFLGQTIGGGRLVDCYVCSQGNLQMATLVARFGNDGPEYYSTDPNFAHPSGHAELFAARAMWEESQNDPDYPTKSPKLREREFRQRHGIKL